MANPTNTDRDEKPSVLSKCEREDFVMLWAKAKLTAEERRRYRDYERKLRRGDGAP
jgi:hypothetical protein